MLIKVCLILVRHAHLAYDSFNFCLFRKAWYFLLIVTLWNTAALETSADRLERSRRIFSSLFQVLAKNRVLWVRWWIRKTSSWARFHGTFAERFQLFFALSREIQAICPLFTFTYIKAGCVIAFLATIWTRFLYWCFLRHTQHELLKRWLVRRRYFWKWFSTAYFEFFFFCKIELFLFRITRH